MVNTDKYSTLLYFVKFVIIKGQDVLEVQVMNVDTSQPSTIAFFLNGIDFI